jgi:hypothetical protein
VHVTAHADSCGHDTRSGSSVKLNKLLIAGIAAAGAAAIAVNPMAAKIEADAQHQVVTDIEQRAVRLTSGLSDVLAQASTNVQTLESEAAVSLPALSQSIGATVSNTAAGVQAGANLQTLAAALALIVPALQQEAANVPGAESLISTGLSGAETSLQNALYGGWYGGDDGFVFGLFGGTVTGNGVTESGSTLQEIATALQQGNAFDAYGYAEEWSLEVIDHTLKPLLSPFLNTAKAGATPTATIPGEVLQTLTALAATLPTPLPSEVLQTVSNLTATFASYPTIKALGDAALSPGLSVSFGAIGDLSTIASDVGAGNVTAAVTDTAKVPTDLLGDLLNGYVYPNATTNPTGAPFTGLLNKGSLLQDLVQTWPNEIVTALSPLSTAASTTTTTESVKTAPSTTAAAVTSSVDDATSPTATVAAPKTGTKRAGLALRALGIKHADASSDAKDSATATSHRGTGDAGTSSKKDTGGRHRLGAKSASSHASAK